MRQSLQTIPVGINGTDEVVRFGAFALSSERMPFELQQTYGLDHKGELSTTFLPFPEDSVEQLMLDVMATGNVELIADRGLLLCERPSAKSAARSLAVYDPETALYYTLGGIGTLTPSQDSTETFVLRDPQPEKAYRDYLAENELDLGGTVYFSDAGSEVFENASRLGVFAYDQGKYHLLKKTLDNEVVKQAGICAPDFIAAGKISNLDGGKWGFSIYRSYLTPEYLLNLHLFIDRNANLKPHYQRYLESKYQQLAHLHRKIGKMHGQPSNTNTMLELMPVGPRQDNQFTLRCQVKDYETLNALPTNTDTIVVDGICQLNIGRTILKSPLVAAMVYDLQLALTQEFNTLVVPVRMINDPEHQRTYLLHQIPLILSTVVAAYGINQAHQFNSLVDFTLRPMLQAMDAGLPVDKFNLIVGGVAAHAMFGFSDAYHSQIEVR